MVITEDLRRWMEDRHFRFERLVITGIDNRPVLKINNPAMVEEETCLFHRSVPHGDDYLNRLHQRVEQALSQGLPLPVVRFADGEYAFYQDSLACNGLYRQAESVHHIKRALPLHIEALQTLLTSGISAPLVFPGNVARKTVGFFSFIKKPWGKKPSASTFLAFLGHHALPLTGDNYIPFYVIYAWLTSAHFARSVDQRKVCILNADWDAQAVGAWFKGFSSRPELIFVDIPREFVATQWSSQRETVLAKIPPDTSLCLIGAGIGALPVCVDVAKRLSIPAIDAGHALNMMNDRVDKSNGARLYTLWKTL
jgi:hypothetical protein